MKEQLENILRSVFSICIMLAVAGGVVVTALFAIALIAGGKTGQTLAVDTGKIYLPYFIQIASIGVISGLLVFYLGNSHALSLEAEKKEKAVEQSTTSLPS